MSSFYYSNQLFSILELCNITKCYKYAVGAFFSASITPSSSGGDPMAFYLMTKDKIPVSHSAIALFTKLMVYQFVMIILASISFFTSYKQITTTLGNFKYLVFLGLFLKQDKGIDSIFLFIFHK